MKRTFFLISITLIVMLSACAPTPETAPPTDTPTETQPAPTATAEPTPLPPTDTPVPPSLTPEEEGGYPKTLQLGDPLPDDGAWLLVYLDYKYTLLSEDGEHQVEVDPYSQFSSEFYVSYSPSPTGKMVAVLVGGFGTEKNLYLWSLTENTVTHIAEVYHPDNFAEASNDLREDVAFSAGQTAWSHDGSLLAFISAEKGASTDLYVYNLANGELLWLTSGPTLAVNPVWTPDDASILHAGVEKLYIGYSGRGYEGWQFFSAEPDGSQVHTLAAGSVEGQGDEEYLGWVSERQMLIHSGYWFCGWFDLRMLNVVSGEEYFIWRGSYSDIAYAPEAGAALVYLEPTPTIDEEYCGLPERDPGLYLLTIPDGRVTPVDTDALPDGFYDVENYSGEFPFYLNVNNRWFTVDGEGDIAPFDGIPYLPEQFWDLDLYESDIFGWVSAGGL
jgi:hypothetical protein